MHKSWRESRRLVTASRKSATVKSWAGDTGLGSVVTGLGSVRGTARAWLR